MKPNLEMSNPQSLIPNSLFFVRTPTATVTDLGTEFGVEVSDRGMTHVQVFQGVVKARATGAGGGSDDCRQLREGEAVEIGGKRGHLRMATFARNPSPGNAADNRQPDPSEAAYIKAVLADRPMGYWPLNKPAGTRKFLDRSGNGVHGYAMGSPQRANPVPCREIPARWRSMVAATSTSVCATSLP